MKLASSVCPIVITVQEMPTNSRHFSYKKSKQTADIGHIIIPTSIFNSRSQPNEQVLFNKKSKFTIYLSKSNQKTVLNPMCIKAHRMRSVKNVIRIILLIHKEIFYEILKSYPYKCFTTISLCTAFVIRKNSYGKNPTKIVIKNHMKTFVAYWYSTTNFSKSYQILVRFSVAVGVVLQKMSRKISWCLAFISSKIV